MNYEEAKNTFIQAWGILGNSWGINKVMAQIHALLLTSSKPLTQDMIMAELKISRGNVNMNLRALLDWGIAKKVLIPGERKEYYETIKDVNELAKIIIRERRKRELEPVLDILKSVSEIDINNKNEEQKAFRKTTKDLKDLTETVNNAMEKFSKTDLNWVYKTILKL